MKKYEFTDETICYLGHKLTRIRALKDFGNVKAGDLGGFLEKESNLSHEGNAWVFEDAKVFEDARVFGDAFASGNAEVFGNARVFGDAWIFGNAKVSGNARVFGNAWVFGNARVFGKAIVFGKARISDGARVLNTQNVLCIGPIGSRNDITTFYTGKDSQILVSCGCFHGTIDEFYKKVKETHKGGRYEEEYKLAIELAKRRIL